MARSLLLMLFLLSCNMVFAQEYNYKHYTIQDGLPSNTVYDVRQDNEGFIWIATDAGVSRFDGRQFVTFGLQDGLPSTDVIRIFPDSKGRIWMSPMRNTVCYYYKGKIYNYQNDSLLQKLTFNAPVIAFVENEVGDVMIFAVPVNGKAYIIHPDNSVTDFTQQNPNVIFHNVTKGFEPDEFLLVNHQRHHHNYVYSYRKGKATMWMSYIYNTQSRYVSEFDYVNGQPKLIDSQYLSDIRKYLSGAITFEKRLIYGANEDTHVNSQSTTSDTRKTLFNNTNNGSTLLDTNTGKIIERLLPGKRTSRSVVDSEGNFWIGTLTEGLFMLPSREFKTYSFPVASDIFSIYKDSTTLYAGSNISKMHVIRNNKITTIDYSSYLQFVTTNKDGNNRLTCIYALNKDLYLGFDGFILKQEPGSKKPLFSLTDVIKSMNGISNERLLVSTGRSTILKDQHTLNTIDTVWHYRTYASLAINNAIYCGTSGGLYKLIKNSPPFYMGNINPAMQGQISGLLASTDGSIWVSTQGSGVLQLKNDTIAHHLTTANGLVSNTCKTMHANGKFLWVGTERGLERIDQLNPGNPVLHYTTADGLAANDIHSISSYKDTLYVGTNAGLTFFDTSKVNKPSNCFLRLLEIEAHRVRKHKDSLMNMNYKENDFRFSYTAISFRSSDNITYHYRLKGMKDGWDSTLNTSLEFLSLHPGAYELEIFAVNKFGVNSNTLHIPFYIQPPFWSTWWFRLLVTGMIISLAWWLIIRRIRLEQVKAATQSKINELEQMALRSQMNPHFIFNCLNSIQNFLLHNNFEKTNEYLTAFAQLIRQTLDNSSRSSISLENEMKYLNGYLELESMRFAHSFKHSIQLDPAIDADNTYIPTMILQPYVENSIRHGLRYRQEDGLKTVKIIFEKRGNTLLCIVEDNGVGRKKAAEFKSFMHVEYQSKGMTLTAERIAALNRLQEVPITVDVIDMEEAGNATGTQVIVRFPNVFL